MIAPQKDNERYGWRVEDWAEAAGCGRSTAWLLIKENRVDSVCIGRRRVIRTHPRDYLARLAEEQKAAA